MSYISNISQNQNEISFELNNRNSIKLSLANAIRRVIISEIPTYAIDMTSVKFIENTSMLHNSFLSRRLSLIPLNYQVLRDLGDAEVTIRFDRKNTTEEMMSIYVKDFDFSHENVVTPEMGEMLFGKLKPGQSIHFECKVIKGNSKFNGTFFTPTSKSILTYKKDEKTIAEMANQFADEKDKKYFLETQTESIYLKNENGEPETYVLEIESINIDPKLLVKLGLTVLKEKIEFLIDSINSKNESKIIVSSGESNFESTDFLMIDEDHTLGNLISSYLNSNEKVKFAGYQLIHPNDNKTLITTALSLNNTVDENVKVFIETSRQIIQLIDKLLEEWEGGSKEPKTVSKKIRVKKAAATTKS